MICNIYEFLWMRNKYYMTCTVHVDVYYLNFCHLGIM